VVTVHSLEPLRPWKREQLRGGYDVSSWLERMALQTADAVIAVSAGTRDDIVRLFGLPPQRVHVIHNGIDLDLYRPASDSASLARQGIDLGRPYVLFVGRITRQKGIVHLVRAIPSINTSAQVVLCAGAPDTPEIDAEMRRAVAQVQAEREGVIWIREMLPRAELVELYSHATVFCCPSIYEPFGIINLEAMACGTAVVATAVGGIPEVVLDGETGLLVPLEQHSQAPFEPVDPARFSADLAAAVNRLLADETLRSRLVAAGLERVRSHFSWRAIAERTAALYAALSPASRACARDALPSTPNEDVERWRAHPSAGRRQAGRAVPSPYPNRETSRPAGLSRGVPGRCRAASRSLPVAPPTGRTAPGSAVSGVRTDR
jgi:glycogen synthase